MRMIKKILDTIFDYPISNLLYEKSEYEEPKEDYWDGYFKGEDILEAEVPYYIEPKEENSKCKVFNFSDYRQGKTNADT